MSVKTRNLSLKQTYPNTTDVSIPQISANDQKFDY